MAAALLGFFALSLAVGSVSIPLDSVIAILWDGAGQKPSWTHIIHSIRLPRALTAILAGAALSASGLQMQTLFRNPLADPFILGISAGASLGVALVVLGTGVTGAGLLGGLGFSRTGRGGRCGRGRARPWFWGWCFWSVAACSTP